MKTKDFPSVIAAPDDAVDWEGVAADQAMTIAMMTVDYQQLQALVTSQGIRLMESEGAPDPMQTIHAFGREQEAREDAKDAARFRWLRDEAGLQFLNHLVNHVPIKEWDEAIDAAQEEQQ